MNAKISITQKYYIYFLTVFLVSIAVVSVYSYYVAKNSILERTFKQLESIRFEKSNFIDAYFQDKIKKIEFVTRSIQSKSNSDIENYTNDSVYFEEIKQVIDGFAYDYSEIIFFDNKHHIFAFDFQKNKKLIISDSIKVMDNLIKINKIIIEKQTSLLFDYVNLDYNKFELYFGTPIFRNDSLIGIMILKLKNALFFDVMYDNSKNSGLGNSGESYIVGFDKIMRTTSRFDNFAGKLLIVNTKATQFAINNRSGNGIIKDYRNIDVISSYSPLMMNGLKWIMIVEIDKEEALKPIYNLRNSIIILVLIVSILIFGLVYFGSITISNPIIELKDAAKSISKGDYKIRLISKSNDELGELITAFNEMSEQLSIQSEQIQRDKMNKISTMIDTLETERKRLSRDLHDGLGQMLIAIKMKLEQVKNSDKDKSILYLDDALDLLIQTINEIRSISNDLTPTVLEMFGLADGLKKLCRDTFNNSGIEYSFSCDNINNLNIDSKKKIYIFRIIQELINNIQKHSKASKASFEINFDNDNIIINICDNGLGFNSNISHHGKGLPNIHDRIELLNGNLIVKSEINKGTTFFITIPIENNEN